MNASLQQALETLYGPERRGTKFDLDGTRALLQALGNPHERFRSVHVAGTNGKGSVCAMVERALRQAGHRTGLFTSPHLVDFRERIRVNGRWVDEAWLGQKIERIQALPEGKDRTFFEVCTALAFTYFAEQQVEIAVVEVGLGGRLDCTNVITPLVSVITSIGLDHTELLGDTLEKIAAEKAGIIKPGVPVVASVQEAGPFEVIERAAKRCGSRLVRARGGRATERLEWNWEPILGPLSQRANIPTAIQTLLLVAQNIPVSQEAIQLGIEATRWPGRCERCPTEPRLWWDGAHNRQAANILVSTLLPFLDFGRVRPGALVFAASSDKDVRGMLEVFRDRLGLERLIAARSRSARAFEPEAIREIAAGLGIRAEAMPDVRSALRRALETTAPEGLVLLTGSLFAVGEAMEAFGGAPGELL